MILCFSVLTWLLSGVASAESDVGVGLVLGYPTGFTFQSEKISSIHLGYAFNFGGSSIRSNIDHWFYTSKLSSESIWYVGGGLAVGAFLSPTTLALEVAGRVPVGIQYYPAETIELFAEVAPTFAIFPQTAIGVSPAVGLRFHFSPNSE